jgi:L-threonylcarbamoyladenylate synthase
MTRVLQVDPLDPDPALISEAAAALRAGQLVAFPTETVYGLGANAVDAQAVERIFVAKGRPTSDPLIVHIADLSQLEQVVVQPPPLVFELAWHFWPGPLTLVLQRGPQIPANVSAGRSTVAVRLPAHPVAHALLVAAQVPVAAPSANLFARPSPTRAQHVLDDLAGRIDILVDGGPAPVGVESTVLDLTVDPPLLLRPGGVTLEDVRLVVPAVSYQPRYLVDPSVPQAPAAPGMLLRHYAPQTAMILFDGEPMATLTAMRAEAQRAMAAGQRVGVLIPAEEASWFSDLPVRLALLGNAAEPAQIAARLFDSLRDLDSAQLDLILTRTLERTGLGLAIWDRLFRATEGRVVHVNSTS